VSLAGADARKVTLVLRRRTGDEVEICDSAGSAFVARLRVERDEVGAVLERALAAPPERSIEVVLAQALPKGQKMDFVVEKATELGVSRIVPLVTERTIGAAERTGKTERWRRLAQTAAQQCGRRDVPEIEQPVAWDALLERLGEVDVALVPWELAEPVPLRDCLPGLLLGARSVLVAIGPEGGLAHSEAERAGASGAHLISLGRRILRTETAALVTCSAIFYAAGEL
jgi:16S rRNA (uracil1498-N3)-methyltransferase